MQRRFLLTLSAAGTALALAGCGFELRKAPNFPFKTIYIPYSEGTALGIELRRSLESGGNVRVITDSRFLDQADVVLDVVSETREKIVVSRNAAGLVREFQLRLRFVFRLRSAKGRELIPNAEILQQRDISFNESAVMA